MYSKKRIWGKFNGLRLLRQFATYVDKILKGSKPPISPSSNRPSSIWVINLKTAKQIGVTIPSNVLAPADKVIK